MQNWCGEENLLVSFYLSSTYSTWHIGVILFTKFYTNKSIKSLLSLRYFDIKQIFLFLVEELIKQTFNYITVE